MKAARSLLGAAVLSALAFVLVVACSPSQVQTLKARGPGVAARLACVVLRWTTPEGFSRELCATADELADLGEELLRARSTSAPLVAAEPIAVLEVSRRVPRRRCDRWVPILSRVEVDSGTRNTGASPDGHRAGEGIDGGREVGGLGGDAGR